jgi:hypothetical protein
VRRFIMFHGRQHPSRFSAAHVLQFLTSLAEVDQVSAGTQNQALAALVFFYTEVLGLPLVQLGSIPRARRPSRLPVVMTRGEVQKDLRTTMVYTHVLQGGALGVESPLDRTRREDWMQALDPPRRE